MSDTPIMLSRNPDNRDRTHWLGDDGQSACWDSHAECARHKVEQLIAALAALVARADAAFVTARLLSYHAKFNHDTGGHGLAWDECNVPWCEDARGFLAATVEAVSGSDSE